MTGDDQEWRKRLQRDPFAGKGFDDRLRKRIEDRLDGEQSRRRQTRRIAAWRRSAAVFASLLVAVLLATGFWSWRGGGADEVSQREDALLMAASPASAEPAPSPEAPAKRYALLLGLRKDEPQANGVIRSTYRSVLVAQKSPDPASISLVTSADGLFVPHKMYFWEVAPSESGDGRLSLHAERIRDPAKRPAAPADAVVPDDIVAEKVLFAGNEYVSLSRTVRQSDGETTERYPVKSIEDLDNRGDALAPEPRYSLPYLVSNTDASASEAAWRIVRMPGRWAALMEDDSGGVRYDLPEALVNQDSLAWSWADLIERFPNARDAFMYGNLLGIETERGVEVYPIRGSEAVGEAVTIPLDDEESIVMIQWAEGDTYVNRWMADLTTLSARSSSAP